MVRRNPRFFDKGLKGWIISYAKKNYWRVAAWMDLDDLIQEGFVCYAICRARYDDRVENQRHFMALVKICFVNQITDLANQRTAELEIAISQLGDDDSENSPLESILGGIEGDAELAALLATAPAEIQKLMKLAASPQWASLMDVPLRDGNSGPRKSMAERLGALLEMPEGSLGIEEQFHRLLDGLTPNPTFSLISHPARGAIRAWSA